MMDHLLEIVFHPRAQHGKGNALPQHLEFEIQTGNSVYNQQSDCLLQTQKNHMFVTDMIAYELLLNAKAQDMATDKFAKVNGSIS